MSWRFRKIFQVGPIRTSVSKRGVGASWGIPGFRIGISPDGKKYVSLGIPGTGLFFIKYLSGKQTKTTNSDKSHQPKTQANTSNNVEPWWKQKDL